MAATDPRPPIMLRFTLYQVNSYLFIPEPGKTNATAPLPGLGIPRCTVNASVFVRALLVRLG